MILISQLNNFESSNIYLMYLFLALIISGSISKESRDKDTASSVTLLQLDPKSGAVASSCSLPEMPEPARHGHTMDGDWACGGSPGEVMT